MQPLPVIVHLHVFEYLPLGLLSCPEPAAINLLNLQRPDQALTRGIVPAVAFTAHARRYTMRPQQILQPVARILASPIRMEKHLYQRTAT